MATTGSMFDWIEGRQAVGGVLDGLEAKHAVLDVEQLEDAVFVRAEQLCKHGIYAQKRGPPPAHIWRVGMIRRHGRGEGGRGGSEYNVEARIMW